MSDISSLRKDATISTILTKKSSAINITNLGSEKNSTTSEIATGSSSEFSDLVSLNGPFSASKKSTILQGESLEALFIGDLDLDVTEQLLNDIFSKYVSFISSKICHNKYTKISLGHGYLNFGSHVDSERAIEELNYTKILKKEVRIMPSMRNPEYRNKVGTNVFFSNLPLDNHELTTRFFFETFRKFGKILSCKLDRDKKIGFLSFFNESDAHRVINMYNNKLFFGSIVFCAIHHDKALRNNISLKSNNTDTDISYKKENTKNETVISPNTQNNIVILKRLPLNFAKESLPSFLKKYEDNIKVVQKFSINQSWIYINNLTKIEYKSIRNKYNQLESLGKYTGDFIKNSKNPHRYSNDFKVVRLSNLCVLCNKSFLEQLCVQENITFLRIKIEHYESKTTTFNGYINCKTNQDAMKLVNFLDGKLIGGMFVKAVVNSDTSESVYEAEPTKVPQTCERFPFKKLAYNSNFNFNVVM